MVNFSTPHGLEGLFDLDRQGVDIRPTLLRVLTDQYLRCPEHSPAEERRYVELATRLINEVDIATRAAVSARLAQYAGAPRSIILDLARDVLEVAEPVLLHAPCLTRADCEAIIAEGGAFYAEIIARRNTPVTPAPLPILKPPATPEPPVLPGSPTTVPAAEAESWSISELCTLRQEPSPDADPGPDASELCELFFAAGGRERRLILLNLDYASWPATPPPFSLLRNDIMRLETAALRHNTDSVVRELARALGVSSQQARRIVEDDLGDPVVVAAKAICLPAEVLQRILLFINPRVGLSVDRVFDLAALYDEISVDAARRLVAIMRAAERAEPQARLSAVETARRSLSTPAGLATTSQRASRLQRLAGAG